MAEKIRSTKQRRSPQLFSRLKSFLQRQRWPARLAFLIAASVLAIFLAIIFFSYGSSVYSGWHERRLLHRAASMLQQERFKEAAQNAQEVVKLHRESLPAFYILAEAAEKQNLEETVWSREQPWIVSPAPIATEPPFMSSRAGWRVRKEISPSKRGNSRRR